VGLDKAAFLRCVVIGGGSAEEGLARLVASACIDDHQQAAVDAMMAAASAERDASGMARDRALRILGRRGSCSMGSLVNQCRPYKRQDVEQALESMVAAGRITKSPIGRGSYAFALARTDC